MQRSFVFRTVALLSLSMFLFWASAWGQSASAGTIGGTIEDSSGAIVAKAKIEISYAVNGIENAFPLGTQVPQTMHVWKWPRKDMNAWLTGRKALVIP